MAKYCQAGNGTDSCGLNALFGLLSAVSRSLERKLELKYRRLQGSFPGIFVPAAEDRLSDLALDFPLPLGGKVVVGKLLGKGVLSAM
jgi:hypothetical protein